MKSLVLNTFRGTRIPTTLDEARQIHNGFLYDNSPPGMEIARSLGGVSHNVYVPAQGVDGLSDAKADELLLMDYWADAMGSGRFLSNENLRLAATRLFSAQDHSQWVPAQGALTFQVPAKFAGRPHFFAAERVAVRSFEAGIAEFAKVVSENIRETRRLGQLSHGLFVRVTAPGEPVELLAVDFWSGLEGLKEHYQKVVSMRNGSDSFIAPPARSIWEQASDFCEW